MEDTPVTYLTSIQHSLHAQIESSLRSIVLLGVSEKGYFLKTHLGKIYSLRNVHSFRQQDLFNVMFCFL